MKQLTIEELIAQTAPVREADRAAAAACQDRIVSRMIDTAQRETERLEHHLLEMPLPVIIYQWIVLRLKCHPWKLLVPAAMTLSLLLQAILSRLNLLQILAR